MAYKWEGMTKISLDEAKKRYKEGKEVYILYDDTEALVEEESVFKELWIDQVEFGYEN